MTRQGRVQLPMRHIRRVHFVGIGGAGMNGIAEVLFQLGYIVSGSDLQENEQTRRLREMGVDVRIGHDAQAIQGADVVVVSTAIPQDNPERAAAVAARIPIIARAAMLGELMRFSFGIAVAGTHGKTTTASLTAHLLEQGGLDPSSIIGGKLRHGDAHATLGRGDCLVCEADESDASFLHLNPLIAVLTNIDDDHLVNYGNDMEQLLNAYRNFLQNLPFYGLAVLCADDTRTMELGKDQERQVVCYGIDAPDADIIATDVRIGPDGSRFRLCIPDEADIQVHLNLPGEHNIRNALAAVAVARDRQVEVEVIVAALASFGGIARRLEMHGALSGLDDVLWVDDYGHHPTEITATLAAMRRMYPKRRLVLSFQPHRYTRTRDLFADFVTALRGADELVLLEVYPADEKPLPGVDSAALAQALREHGMRLSLAQDQEQMTAALQQCLRPGDVLLTSGAGSIGRWVADLPAQLGAPQEVLA